MHKSRIYTLLGVSTIVLYGLVVFLIPRVGVQPWVIIGIAMALVVLVSVLLTGRMVDNFTVSLKERTAELKATRQELDAIKAKMAQVTNLDELTGCYNRRHFIEMLLHHRAMSERGTYHFTLAIAQVDQFAAIVESRGLERGHEVLQLFARIVKAALREVDVIARLEADKFGLILSGCSEADALNIINRISQLIGQIQVTDADDVTITSSGGLTSYHGTESAEELISHAEQALAVATSEGPDTVAGYNYTPPAGNGAQGNEPA